MVSEMIASFTDEGRPHYGRPSSRIQSHVASMAAMATGQRRRHQTP